MDERTDTLGDLRALDRIASALEALLEDAEDRKSEHRFTVLLHRDVLHGRLRAARQELSDFEAAYPWLTDDPS